MQKTFTYEGYFLVVMFVVLMVDNLQPWLWHNVAAAVVVKYLRQ